MLSSAIATALERRNIFYGWVIVGATLLTTVITAAAMSAPGVLIVPLEQEFGWTDAKSPRPWRSGSCCSDCSVRSPPRS